MNKNTNRTLLLVPRSEAISKVQAQIDKGIELLAREIVNVADIESAREDYNAWMDYCFTLLKNIVSTYDLYQQFAGSGPFRSSGKTFEDHVKYFRVDVRFYVKQLESILAQLELFNEGAASSVSTKSPQTAVSNRVFLVHGHDKLAQQTVARFLEQIQLDPIILEEKPGEGRTIIESFEYHSNVAFVIVLLTPDDKMASGEFRARQNVIFEWGYFVGRLERKRVCALLKGAIEKPSDLHDILHHELDDKGAWKLRLAKELRAAGLPVDIEHLLSE